MTITTAPALASFEDTWSVTSALRSPDALVRETLAGLVTVAARCRIGVLRLRLWSAKNQCPL
jgi:hypothetical protein